MNAFSSLGQELARFIAIRRLVMANNNEQIRKQDTLNTAVAHKAFNKMGRDLTRDFLHVQQAKLENNR